MILDSSAIIALLREEPGYERLRGVMDSATLLGVGAPTLVETGMVAIGRFGPIGRPAVSQFLADWSVEVIPFGAGHWEAAFAAFARFGRGRHPAKLNYGDCMTYATARFADLPLLCTGDDFPQTDLAIA